MRRRTAPIPSVECSCRVARSGLGLAVGRSGYEGVPSSCLFNRDDTDRGVERLAAVHPLLSSGRHPCCAVRAQEFDGRIECHGERQLLGYRRNLKRVCPRGCAPGRGRISAASDRGNASPIRAFGKAISLGSWVRAAIRARSLSASPRPPNLSHGAAAGRSTALAEPSSQLRSACAGVRTGCDKADSM